MPDTKPILFSGPMVRAILDGRKTQTRRVVKPQPTDWQVRVCDISPPFFDDDLQKWGQIETIWDSAITEPMYEAWHPMRQPYKPGDVLWVRETWRDVQIGPEYRANYRPEEPRHGGIWRPSIFMPKWASRLFLLVTDVRCQRVQEISRDDAVDEGIYMALSGRFANYPDGETIPGWDNPIESFRTLWDSINAKRGFGWDADPWVWAYTFKQADKPKDWPE